MYVCICIYCCHKKSSNVRKSAKALAYSLSCIHMYRGCKQHGRIFKNKQNNMEAC